MTVLLVLALLGAVAATMWGFAATRADETAHDTGPTGPLVGDGWVDADGGAIRLDAVSARDMGHQMPGMDQNLADPVPEGARRVSTTVTVAATAPEGLELADSDFTLSGPGLGASAPVRAQLGDGRLEEGTAMTVELVFDVPEATDQGLVLAFGEALVPVPGLGSPAPATPLPSEPAAPTDDHPHASDVPDDHPQEGDQHGH